MSEPFAGAGRLRRIADYQFGPGAGEALFSERVVEVTRSASGRPRQVIGPRGRLVSRGTDGRFTLGIAGGRRLADALDPPRGRVAVGEESVPFVRDGENAFAKFVRGIDPEVRPGDEVLVVFESESRRSADGGEAGRDAPDAGDGDLLGVGRAELPASAMADFESGMAVKVREGTDESDE